ncbi:MAG TPA: o-succinylbenzoate synthase [Thermoanaerobaculia bacterium]|nr:o-succinylbenzoate synthase [Thermoanaerobaculia bacterium]
MRIAAVELTQIRLPLVAPFETSLGRTSERNIILVRVDDGEGAEGWGECVADERPHYSEEWTGSAWPAMETILGPMLAGQEIERAGDVAALFEPIRGNRMAKAAIEAACWDLEARRRGLPLWQLLGGERREIACGVSIGLQPSIETLLAKIERELAAGYQRIKVKIKPGRDIELLAAVRERFPDVPLMADANSAYRLHDAPLLRNLDSFDLMMIEQPLAHDDIADHARLQQEIMTPICLDESIRTAADARHAVELGACRIINIKMGRVGGHSEARRIERLCRESGVPVWCGGMLEAGIGRAHNIALSTLAGFMLPGDVSASARYWEEDIIDPAVTVTARGTIVPPPGPGIGYEVRRDRIDKLAVRRSVV